MNSFIKRVAGAAAAMLCGILAAMAEAPEPGAVRVEAEAAPPPGATVVPDPGASGGRATESANPWNPLFRCPLKPGPGKLTVRVRRRGGPINLKVRAGTEWRELCWNWDRPKTWEWVRLGPFDITPETEEVMLIRNDTGPSPAIDCVDVSREDGDGRSAEAAPDPYADEPDPVTIRVNWGRTVARTTPASFGLNAFAGFNPETAATPAYQDNLRYMNPGLLRYHSWEMIANDSRGDKGRNSWLDHGARQWDAQKIAAALDACPVPPERVLISIPGWPPWMRRDDEGCLDPDEHEAFAAFCAELVRVVNGRQKRGVVYWEATNEMDGCYGFDRVAANQPERLAEWVALWNRCAEAMKQADPNIRVGGPAAARPWDMERMRVFVRGTRDRLDFFSFHMYASGSADEPDGKVLAKPDGFGGMAAALVAMVREESPDRRIETHLNEFNISWTWTTRDVRMRNHKGAVFDALTLAAAARAGVDAVNAWNEMDGVYGKTGADLEPRPAAHIYHLFAAHCVGAVADSDAGDAQGVVPFAVATAAGHSLVLINRSPRPRRCRIEEPAGTRPGALFLLDETGLSRQEYPAGVPREMTLPPFSVTVRRTDG